MQTLIIKAVLWAVHWLIFGFVVLMLPVGILLALGLDWQWLAETTIGVYVIGGLLGWCISRMRGSELQFE